MRRFVLASLAASVLLTAAEPSRKIFPFAYDQHDFPNGLRLVSIPTEFPNVVSLYIVVQTGSRNEIEPGKSGFAHFFEHVMFRGTKQYPPERYEAVLKDAGAASNAYTSSDMTVYHTTFSKEDFEKILAMEADRFLNLEYTPDVFKTEALAVLGEYNKNSAAPFSKLNEVLRETAFDRHTYKHTTMGFLRDIQDMPNQYEYSKEFFKRFYRPEYTVIVVAGDIRTDATKTLVGKYWGGWKRGDYKAAIPEEPPQKGPREKHVDWSSPTLPIVTVSYRGPEFSDTDKEMAVLDLISFLGFSPNSELYQKLVVEEQKLDSLSAMNPNQADPYLFTVMARVKKESEMAAIRERILSTLNGFKDTLVPEAKLEGVKRHLRYEFALSLDSSEAIASVVAQFVGLTRTPESINRIYALYEKVTPEDIRQVARKYFNENSRTVVTLATGKAQ